ncbi:receptor-type tyrosine-protein phosphatase epsilon-like [Amphiura filiformis]|uniref:receptor-type tyrosine-protein phosphatase epsilon-like n=1 Tax=Amphiura filiformis TaxID=82378 RepID=UPI003B225548
MVTNLTESGKNSGDESQTLEVCQFHYTTWPDFSVPDNGSAFLNFVKIVNNYRIEDMQPTIVHCSAGVGRTGTFIAIESLMKQANDEKQIDVFKFVSDMRNNRMQMIQTSEQYQFIFEALVEYVMFGDTSIPVSGFHETFRQLKIGDSETNQSGFDIQFKNLEDVSLLPKPEECKAGATDENINKNRFRSIIPGTFVL